MPAESSTPPRRGRPPSAAKGEAILDAATTVFMRDGYSGATVDAVAAAAGVSKQTVYSRFVDKEALFHAVIDAARAARMGRPPQARPSATGLLDAADLRGALVAFGAGMLSITLAPQVAAFRRLIIAEMARMPQLRDMWSAGGPLELFERLRADVAELDRRGVLDVPDAGRAARQWISLLAHEGNMRSLYGVVELDAEQRREIATEAADMFLRAYARRG